MRKLNVIAILLCLFAFFSACGKQDSLLPEKPSKLDFVFDYADMLDPQLEDKIRQLGQELRQKTTAELVLVTLPTRKAIPITEVTYRIFNDWGLGDKEKHNGCLLLLVRDNLEKQKKGKVRIEVGKGLEGRLNDAKCGRILDDLLLPGFDGRKSGGVTASQAVENSYTFLAQEIAAEYDTTLSVKQPVALPSQDNQPSSWTDTAVNLIVPLFFVFFFIYGILSRNRHGGGYGGYGGYGGGYGGYGGYGGGGDFGGGSSGGGGADR